jgi:hypothetical protein
MRSRPTVSTSLGPKTLSQHSSYTLSKPSLSHVSWSRPKALKPANALSAELWAEA